MVGPGEDEGEEAGGKRKGKGGKGYWGTGRGNGKRTWKRTRTRTRKRKRKRILQRQFEESLGGAARVEGGELLETVDDTADIVELLVCRGECESVRV